MIVSRIEKPEAQGNLIETFSNPIVSKRGVTVELIVAGKGLEKKAFLEMIQGSLENTNWKVNEKSILVNLGILQGKLEGVG